MLNREMEGEKQLIHLADPKSRSVGSDHYFHTCCPSVRLHISKYLQKQAFPENINLMIIKW